MVIEAYELPKLYNVLAALSSWLLLAGFVIFPGTFTSLQKADLTTTEAGKVLHRIVQNTPLLGIAIVCYVLGSVGTGILWWLFKQNSVWLNEKIFLPGLINAITGLITTLINIYTAKDGVWSITATITIVFISVIFCIMGVGFIVYSLHIRRLQCRNA
ncbi:hypothetical protein F5Y06DRAFT_288625 [Hypoxylon sp. FL0890]|nr:hypothetical protein F5Y06DRAFT_288625 [Hypoxylon sp. FL0890]